MLARWRYTNTSPARDRFSRSLELLQRKIGSPLGHYGGETIKDRRSIEHARPADRFFLDCGYQLPWRDQISQGQVGTPSAREQVTLLWMSSATIWLWIWQLDFRSSMIKLP